METHLKKEKSRLKNLPKQVPSSRKLIGTEEVLGLEKSEITDRTYDDPEWKFTDFEGTTFPMKNCPSRLSKEPKIRSMT